ncbi:MAG: hypothetical protein IPK26_08700 [Planctomycetes bacterium]|nr:hypothetical protein [Planctomycetota bacterium]
MNTSYLRLALSAVLCLSGSTVRGQEVPDWVDKLRRYIAIGHDVAATAVNAVAVVKALDDYRRALGERLEAEAVQQLVDQYRDAGEVLPAFGEKTVTGLLDFVSLHRRRGRPERMIPLLFELQRAIPDDPRVLYALGEAFGVASPVQNFELARSCFEKLRKSLESPAVQAVSALGRMGLLREFLPELRERADELVWMRDRLADFIDVLERGQHIALWRLADPRLRDLRENLIQARRDGDQKRAAQMLTAMLDLQPDHPAYCYALAEVHASMGPEFKPARTVELVERFLKLTAYGSFAEDSQFDPVLTQDDVLRDLHLLRRALAESDLEARRVAAKELRAAMMPKGATKPKPLLLVPNLKELRERTTVLEKAVTKDAAEVDRLDAEIERVTKKRDAARAELQAAKNDPRKRLYLDRYQDAVQGHNTNLKNMASRKKPFVERLEKNRPEYDACRQRLTEIEQQRG